MTELQVVSFLKALLTSSGELPPPGPGTGPDWAWRLLGLLEDTGVLWDDLVASGFEEDEPGNWPGELLPGDPDPF